MARLESAEKAGSMSDTSAQKKFGNTAKKLPTTSEEAEKMLAMFQAVLAQLNGLPALKAERVNLYDNGEQIAGIVIRGAFWDDAGNLVINAGNAGKAA